jgi:hypothetical protein
MKENIISSLEDQGYSVDESVVQEEINTADESKVRSNLENEFEIHKWEGNTDINGVSPDRVRSIYGLDENQYAVYIKDSEDNKVIFQTSDPNGEIDEFTDENVDEFMAEFYDSFISRKVNMDMYNQVIENCQEKLTIVEDSTEEGTTETATQE